MTAAVKTPISTMTTTLRKGILWRRAERDTGGDCSKNLSSKTDFFISVPPFKRGLESSSN